MRLAVSPRWRRPVCLMAEAAIYALSVLACGSFYGALYLAAVPGFAVWVVLCRPQARRKLPTRHLLYGGFLAALVAGYMFGYTRIARTLTVRWWEVFVALYFLGALHVMLWCLDAAVRKGLSKVPAARGGKGWWRLAAETAVRLAVMVLVGGPVVAAALTTHWIKFDDATNPRRFCGLAYEPAGFYTSDGVHLRGWYLPAADEFRGDSTVIVVPPRGMGKLGVLPQAKRLLNTGSNVLLMDLRGEGGSEGHVHGFGVVEAKDVSAAVNYLRWVRPRQSEQVFVLGISEGATAGLGAAATDRRIDAVVADSVLPSARGELSRTAWWLPRPLNGYFTEATLFLASLQLGCDLRVEDGNARVRWISPRPVLLIHGQDDAVVPIRVAERLYVSAGLPAMLWEVPQAGHAEAFLCDPEGYCQLVSKTLRSVRAGLPAFDWVSPERG